MKSLFVTTALAALLASAAPAFAFDWNGFYAGVGVGYSSGTADMHATADVAGTYDFTMAPAGWLAGTSIGYNAALGNGVVLGIEGDVSLASIGDTVADPFPGNVGETVTSATDWTGTLRGRLGFDAGEILPYLTAGVAVAHSTASFTDAPGDSETATLMGYTVGGGLEVAVTDSVTVKGEYLYTDLGSRTWFAGESYENTSTTRSSTIRGGVNFHF